MLRGFGVHVQAVRPALIVATEVVVADRDIESMATRDVVPQGLPVHSDAPRLDFSNLQSLRGPHRLCKTNTDSCQLDSKFLLEREILSTTQHIQVQRMSRESLAFSVLSRESLGFNVLPIHSFMLVSSETDSTARKKKKELKSETTTITSTDELSRKEKTSRKYRNNV